MQFVGISAFPSVIEDERRIDPWTFLVEKKRMLFLAGSIDDFSSSGVGGVLTPHRSVGAIVDFMLALDAVSSEPIKLFIDSEGGSIPTGLMLYDIMQALRSPVYTIGRGKCASMAAILLASGAPGHRYAFPNCVAMLHLSWGTAQGTGPLRKKREKYFEECDSRLAEIIIRHCKKEGRTAAEILDEWSDEKEMWMFPSEAREYGLIDTIITPEIYRREILGEV